MRSELFSAENFEKESAQPGLRLQNSKLLKAELNGEFMARTGSMVPIRDRCISRRSGPAVSASSSSRS
jgi:hypothetical protein